ncbi:MAG: DUF2332 domain-containing protein [Alphaproteobacteria bacterium]|nr:DUF2332 domain-containing protein [Alphaproteobacteria bacterium]
MNRHKEIRHAFEQQSEWCSRLGSPFTSLLMDVLAEHLSEATRTGSAVLNWDGHANALNDALALRVAGALHAMVRAGRLPELASLYPPNPLPDAAPLAAAVTAALEQADEELLEWLQFAPQTNETARSAVLYAGFMTIAHQTGLPLHLFELGASAGLNLIADRYSYNLGGVKAGCAGSALALAPEWHGPVPLEAKVEVVARQGCDRAPLDVHKPDHCERLVSYVWPDQAERLSRVETAIGLAQKEAVSLDKADAASWVEGQISLEPVADMTRVLFHSIAWRYFSADDQARITRRMEQAGSAASSEAPLAWLSFEQESGSGPQLSLKVWPAGEAQVLATADAHVRKITWR